MSTSPKDWLADSMMNLLVDYYPEVPFRPYGSAATRENVLPVLRELELGYLCIYAKGHSGYTTWPQQPAHGAYHAGAGYAALLPRGDAGAGYKLVLYYSGLLDGIAGLRHPEWRMHNLDGTEQRYFDDIAELHRLRQLPAQRLF